MVLASNFRRAGRLLGLDLAGLFKDDDTLKNTVFMPNLTVSSTARGRGAPLTMMPQQRDPVTTSLTLAPPTYRGGSILNNFNPVNNNTVTVGAGTPAPSPSPAPAPAPAPASRTYNWRENLKGGGFGTADYQNALSQGYSNTDIKDFVTSNPGIFGGSGINIGQDVRAALGLDDSYQSDIAKIASGKAADVKATPYNWRELSKARGGIGAAAVNAALQGGASMQDIEAYAKAYGLEVGEKAAALSPALAQQRKRQTGGASRGPSGGYAGSIEQVGKVGAKPQFAKESGSIGAAGIQRAAAAMGVSPQEAARRAVAQGTTLGPAAQALLG
jgi:hypothetical protein